MKLIALIILSTSAFAYEIGDVWIIPKLYTSAYSMSATTGDNQSVYEPNNRAAFGGSIITKYFTLSGALPTGNENDKVNTKYLDLSLSYEWKKWAVDVYYQKYKGFLLTTNEINLSEDVRPDLETYHYGARGMWAYSDDYRLDHAISLLKKDSQFSWSFLAAAHYDKGKVSGSNYIIDQPVPGLEVLFNNNRVDFEYLGLGGGLGLLYSNSYLFVQSHFLITLGPQKVSFKPTGQSETTTASNTDLRLAIGRNSDQNIFGIVIDYMFHRTGVEETNDFTTIRQNSYIYYGRKF